MRHSSNRTWFHVVLGLFFLALMLFPVYWMVNASLQPGVATVDLSWFPVRPSLDGYRSAFASQGANLVTSLLD
ncbi:Sugar ABC superfamily ATP binding cassette transporter, membrane protein, partial [human gut metagenome]